MFSGFEDISVDVS